jgi:hypothetical protein
VTVFFFFFFWGGNDSTYVTRPFEMKGPNMGTRHGMNGAKNKFQ